MGMTCTASGESTDSLSITVKLDQVSECVPFELSWEGNSLWDLDADPSIGCYDVTGDTINITNVEPYANYTISFGYGHPPRSTHEAASCLSTTPQIGGNRV